MLRYVDIKNEILRHLDEAATSAVTNTTEALVEDAINTSHRRICLSRTWAFMLWPREESVTSTAGVRAIALNAHVGRLIYIWDTDTRMYLTMIPYRQWESQLVDRSATSDFRAAIFGGHWAVQRQPTAATVVTIVSSSVNDITSRQLLVRGVNSSGDVVEETLTATGTTPVNGTTQFVAILNITKLGTWAGTATVKLGSTTILTLTASEYGKQYPTIELVETPQTAKTFLYGFTRVPRTLTNDNDIPEIPFPYSEVLVFDALMGIATYRTDLNAAHLKLWGDRKDLIMKQLMEAQDEAIVGSFPRLVRDLEGANARTVSFRTS